MAIVIHKGFTVIELIVVLIFVGILAAVVVPRYLELHNNAVTSELKAIVGDIESGSARNYARYVALGPLVGKGVKVGDDCETVAIPVALPEGLPQGYTAYGESVMAYPGDYYGTCTVRHEVTGEAQNAMIMLTETAT